MTSDVPRVWRRCCEEAKESLKVIGTRCGIAVVLSRGEICGNSRDTPEESNFIENFTAFHRRHFMGRTFLSGGTTKFSEATDRLRAAGSPERLRLGLSIG